MALRNQPYFPLYVQDYLTDEKLNMCSWKTQGIYIKILCVLHKQSNYGTVLFKQNYKQTEDSLNFFASILVKNLPCQLDDMIEALRDLLDNEVLFIDEIGLHQKRMVKDGQISDKRSDAGKKGGGNPILFKQNYKQNTEYENVNENENKDVKGIKKKFVAPSLEDVKTYFKESGYKEESAEKFYKSYSVANWHDSNDKQIKNWKQKAINVWFTDSNKIELEDKYKAKYKDYTEHLRSDKVCDRLANNCNIKRYEVTFCINEFIDTCFGSIVEKENKFQVEEYFMNWIKKDGRILESVTNQIRKSNAKK